MAKLFKADFEGITSKHRLTEGQKRANKKLWYKEWADSLDSRSFTGRVSDLTSFDKESAHGKVARNYNLFNNILDIEDLKYVLEPYGKQVGEMPATLANRDIVSGKIKVLLGMEETMPFSWGVIAINDDAVSRKEEEKRNRIADFVNKMIMQPIEMQQRQQMAQQTKGRQLTPQEQQQIESEIQQGIQAQTPEEVHRYMARRHLDPSEALMRQILKYLLPKTKASQKFNLGFKHMCLGGKELYHVGIFNGKPNFFPVNPLRFDSDGTEGLEGVQDGEWAVQEIPMTPSQVLATFGDELKPKDIDRVYEYQKNPGARPLDQQFTFDTSGKDLYTIRVLHATWKAPAKIGILSYVDQNGEPQKMVVDDTYQVDSAGGDLAVKWEWIPQAYECYKILDDIYVRARPVPGQFRDIDNLYECKLPYYGRACDDLNAANTAPMDRMVEYQYLYNIIIYRIEMLMASDKGKILAANIGALPRSSGIDMIKFQHFMDVNKIAWYNHKEEGKRDKQAVGGDANTIFNVLDMSLVSDITKYMSIAEYIETKCGNSIGVTKQMEAQIGADESVTNTKQNLVQASYIIRPYFTLHNNIKGDVLTALSEFAKVAFSDEDAPEYVNYILDDMSQAVLHVDKDLLAGSMYNLYIGDATKAQESKQLILQLAQAAMQNQQATILDIIKVSKSDSIQEAEELLEAAKMEADQMMQANENAKQQQAQQEASMEQQMAREEQTFKMEFMKAEEQERRITEWGKSTISAMGYDPNKDEDGDGEPDVMEIFKHGMDAAIKLHKSKQDDAALALEQDKFSHQQQMDAHKKEMDKQGLVIDRKKLSKPKSAK